MALDFAARLANQCGATLHVLHAQDPLLAAAAQSEGIDLVRESREELARFTQTVAGIDPSRRTITWSRAAARSPPSMSWSN